MTKNIIRRQKQRFKMGDLVRYAEKPGQVQLLGTVINPVLRKEVDGDGEEYIVVRTSWFRVVQGGVHEEKARNAVKNNCGNWIADCSQVYIKKYRKRKGDK